MADVVNEIPSAPEECPICNRVEQTLMTSPILRQRLPETEIVSLVEKVQSAILNKEVKKTERGINMADEKYVISKASFEDFYETQDTLVSIMEKMVDRIEKQDQVIMKFGAALTEVMSKGIGMGEEMMPVDESAGLYEEEVPVEEGVLQDEGEELEEVGDDLLEDEEDVNEVKEEVEEEKAGVEPVPGQMMAAPPMMEEKLAAEKSAFEAGYKAALNEMQKKTGVAVTPLEVPTSNGARPVVPSASPVVGKTQLDNLSEKDLANMTPNQINSWLRENKLYR
jgi:hypothetical protein